MCCINLIQKLHWCLWESECCFSNAQKTTNHKTDTSWIGTGTGHATWGVCVCEGGSWSALPSRGVRLAPPFLPSSPCWEYCFRRFWALRMVPAPTETHREREKPARGKEGSSGSGGRGGPREHREQKRREEKREREEGGDLGDECWKQWHPTIPCTHHTYKLRVKKRK